MAGEARFINRCSQQSLGLPEIFAVKPHHTCDDVKNLAVVRGKTPGRSPEAAIVTVAFLWGPQTCVRAYTSALTVMASALTVMALSIRSCRTRLRDDVEVVRGGRSIRVAGFELASESHRTFSRTPISPNGQRTFPS
jgi:hypothetical protein